MFFMGKFSNTYAVRGSEIATDYRLRNFYVSFYFQECFAEYTASKKMAGYDMAKVGLTWLISDVSVEICGRLPFWRAPVTVEIWTYDINQIFVTLNFTLKENGNIFAKGACRALIADTANHKPQRLGDYEKNFAKIDEPGFDNDPFKRLELSGSRIGQTLQVVRVADLDFNMHLNNVRYLPRMFESMPSEITSSRRLAEYQIRYLQEAHLDEKILSETFEDKDGTYYHRLTRASDNELVSVMKSVWTK